MKKFSLLVVAVCVPSMGYVSYYASWVATTAQTMMTAKSVSIKARSSNKGGNETYREFLLNQDSSGSMELWKQWLDQQPQKPLRPNTTALKLLLMTKDEWPMIQKWILYHGRMLGFVNLYVIDGSTDARCVEFLQKQARDEWGVNVIFSQANLNHLSTILTQVAHTLAPTADVIIKMDSDEFLAVDNSDTGCSYTTQRKTNATTQDCSLSPYGVVDYLNSYSFHNLLDGSLLKIGRTASSHADLQLCQSGKGHIYTMANGPDDKSDEDAGQLVRFTMPSDAGGCLRCKNHKKC